METGEIFRENIFKWFQKISEIPRESGNEKGISDFIRKLAEGKGCICLQDEQTFDLMVKVPASAGYENAKTVLLQAHMDMVCEQDSSGTHDFAKDPIRIGVDGDWLISRNGTTLGADDGIGVAAMLAILEDDTLKHPALELAFTACEETTFDGAEHFPADWITAEYMINLDHAVDCEAIAGSCGGAGVNITIPMHDEETPEGWKPFGVKLEGMKGGHSGEDIHRGRGNAISLLFRFVDDPALRLVSVSAGTNRLAIPREAEAVVLAKDGETVAALAARMEHAILREYGELASRMKITVMPLSETVRPLTCESARRAIQFVKLIPNGIVNMNGAFKGIVESSNNLGILHIANGKLEAVCEERGQYQTTIDDISRKINLLVELLGGKTEFFAKYSPWEYANHSPLRELACRTYREQFNDDLHVLSLHAGLECGMFAAKKAQLDILSIGPNCENFHSVSERLSIRSTRKFYRFLLALLENLK